MAETGKPMYFFTADVEEQAEHCPEFDRPEGTLATEDLRADFSFAESGTPLWSAEDCVW